MSKKNKIIILLLVIVAGLVLVSCVKDIDFEVPTSLGEENNKKLTELLTGSATPITIAELKDQFVYGKATKIVSNVYVKGYVSSSDATGNFYKEIFIQDNPSNPTSGLKVVLNQANTYNQFNLGREVYIKLQGLYIGETRSGDDVITIGGKQNTDGDEVEEMSANQIINHVFRTEITEVLTPLALDFSQINDSYIGMYIIVENVQFPSSLEGESYVDENDDFDTSRMMEVCEGFSYLNFPIETSAFAKFKNVILPADKSGTISGVINKTYNGSNAVLVLNSLDDVKLTQSKCTPLNINDFTIIFEENFNMADDNTNLDIAEWTNYAEVGDELWTEQVFNGNGCAEFNGYGTRDYVNISWLISPEIDMGSQNNTFLNFKTAQHHLQSMDNKLEVFVSTNFNGTNVLAATWEPLKVNIASISASWYAFQDSGLINISIYTGALNIAFKVTGSGTDTELDGAYLIDDFKILTTD